MIELALIPAFAVADRLFGSVRRVISVPVILAIAAALYVSLGLPAAILAIVWLGYRSIAMFGGSAAPTAEQRVNAYLRHALGIIPFLTVASVLPDSLRQLAAAGATYGLIAGTLAVCYGIARDKAVADSKPLGNVNTYVETIRGAAFGLAAWAAFSYA